MAVADMVSVCATVGTDASAASATASAASAERRRAALPLEIRERRLPCPFFGGGGSTTS